MGPGDPQQGGPSPQNGETAPQNSLLIQPKQIAQVSDGAALPFRLFVPPGGLLRLLPSGSAMGRAGKVQTKTQPAPIWKKKLPPHSGFENMC